MIILTSVWSLSSSSSSSHLLQINRSLPLPRDHQFPFFKLAEHRSWWLVSSLSLVSPVDLKFNFLVSVQFIRGTNRTSMPVVVVVVVAAAASDCWMSTHYLYRSEMKWTHMFMCALLSSEISQFDKQKVRKISLLSYRSSFIWAPISNQFQVHFWL